MHNNLITFIFLIDEEERLEIKSYSLYAAKARAKRIAGAGTTLRLIEQRKGMGFNENQLERNSTRDL